MKNLRALIFSALSALALAGPGCAALAQSDSDDSPTIIINSAPPSGVGQVLPSQIQVPRVGESFGDPSSIANPAIFPVSPVVPLAPYRWLGAYGAPALGGVRLGHLGIGLGGIGLPYAGFGGLGGWGGYGPRVGIVPSFGGWGGYGGYMPGVAGFGGIMPGLGGWGGYGGYMPGVPGFGGFSPYGGFGGMGYGGFGGMGMGMGMAGMGMGSSDPAFGRLSSTRVIQTAPSKSSGDYYAPATVDPTASGGYYGSTGSTSIVFPTHKSSSQSYTKPQKNYWGSGGNPFPSDLNSVPWSK